MESIGLKRECDYLDFAFLWFKLSFVFIFVPKKKTITVLIRKEKKRKRKHGENSVTNFKKQGCCCRQDFNKRYTDQHN